jgi:transposase-like protein
VDKRTRRRFTAAEKSKSVIRHLQDGAPVSEVCDELQIHPNQYFDWQRVGLAGLHLAFERDGQKAEKRLLKENGELRVRLRDKDSVIAELLAEHIALKKSLGVR